MGSFLTIHKIGPHPHATPSFSDTKGTLNSQLLYSFLCILALTFPFQIFSWPHLGLLGGWSRHYYWAKKKYPDYSFPQFSFRLTINVMFLLYLTSCFSVSYHAFDFILFCFFTRHYLISRIISFQTNMSFQKYSIFFFLLSNLLCQFSFSLLGSILLTFLLKQPLPPSSRYPRVSVSYCQVQETV